MSTEERLTDFEARLAQAGFLVHRTGVNPIAFRLTSAGENVGPVKVWAPLNAKFNEIRDQWRDSVRACWIAAQEAHTAVTRIDSPHWLEVDRLLALFAPYRDDYLDFEDVVRALTTALRQDGMAVPDVDALLYDYNAIERIARSRRK